jgi:transcription termination factor Rho
VTDTQDQLTVLPYTDGDTSGTAKASASATRAKRRSGSLSTMLLPELQALAGSLGIAAGKLRKSDLITAIEAANRAQTSPAAQAPPAVQGATAGPTNDAAANEAEPASRPARSRRGSSRAAGPAQPTPTEDASANSSATNGAETSTPDAPHAGSDQVIVDSSASTRTADGSDQGERSTRSPRGREDNYQGRDGQRDQNRGQIRDGQRDSNRDSQNRDSQRDSNRDSQNRDSQRDQNRDSQRDQNRDSQNRDSQRDQNRDSQNRDSQNRDSQNRDSQNRDSQNRNSGQNRNNAPDDDDDFAGSRRGRRYRDRRGRTRDRFDNSNAAVGRQEAEPTISEDDVLVPVAGILDSVEDKNTWFVRTGGYFASPEDVYVANSHIRRYGLRRGDAVTGAVRQAKDGERKEKYNPLVRLDTVNGVEPDKARNRVEFTKLTPLYPQDRLRLETESHILTTRVIDLVMPIGKGQRALIVSPPKAGKTSVLQAIANAIAVNNPECHLMVVLVDERPEEVTDMQRSVKGEVIASTFDRRPQDHTMIAELSIERAKRLVEMGHDVVVLLDSITRLGRAYNLAAPASGRILSGGVDSTALYPPKRFLGAARNIEDGGSLTIIATALVETGSTMDTVIFEEFKGTGNAELKLDRKIADKRVFPAIDVDQSGTRKEEILLSPDELAVVIKLRRVLHALDTQQGIDLLLDRLKKSRTNIEFLMQIAKTAPGGDDR